MSAALAVGDRAPDLHLADQAGRRVRLSELTAAGKEVVVVFFPFAFSGICTGELDEVRDHLGDFVGDDREVLAVSCDPMFSLRAWADARGYFFPLLSDFWPHGATAAAYGVLDEDGGYAQRATFVVDREGLVRFVATSPVSAARDFDALRAVLTGG